MTKENLWFTQLTLEKPVSSKIVLSNTPTDINMTGGKFDLMGAFEFDRERQSLKFIWPDNSYLVFLGDASMAVDVEWNVTIDLILYHNDEVAIQTPVTFFHKHHTKSFSANKTIKMNKWDTLQIKVQSSVPSVNTIIECMNIQVIALSNLQ